MSVSLKQALLEGAPPERRPALERMEGVESALQTLFAAAKEAWPTLAISADAFARHVGRGAPAEPTLDGLKALHAPDLLLACACSQGNPEALAAFDAGVLRKAMGRIDPLLREEVAQIARERLLVAKPGAAPKIADYSGRGPLLAWVRIVAARIAGELSERRSDVADGPDPLTSLLASATPELEAVRKDARGCLEEALREGLAALGERERALLRFHHVHGLTLDALAKMYDASRSGLGRELVAARERLVRLTRTHLMERLRLSETEVESLVGAVQSRLDLSVQRLLG